MITSGGEQQLHVVHMLNQLDYKRLRAHKVPFGPVCSLGFWRGAETSSHLHDV